jgi:uncharacterized phage-like protein YoqJ
VAYATHPALKTWFIRYSVGHIIAHIDQNVNLFISDFLWYTGKKRKGVGNVTCAFSGHRPEKLPWGTDETDPRCLALKIQLERTLRQLCREGCLHYLCGMARGTDLYYLEALLSLRAEFPLTLEAVVPCPTQSDRWTGAERLRYTQDLGRCDRTTVLEPEYSPGCMLRRNRAMVDRADILLTVFDGSLGGTAATVRYAKEQGVKIMALWR